MIHTHTQKQPKNITSFKSNKLNSDPTKKGGNVKVHPQVKPFYIVS